MADGFREQLRAAYSFDWLKTQLDELTQATRKRYHEVTCKDCGSKGRYEIDEADTRTRLDALKYIGDMGYGKAAQAKEDQAKPIDTGIDPTTLTPQDRQALIQQLRTRITTSTTPNRNLSGD